MARYGSTSSDGYGNTVRLSSAADSPSIADKKNLTSSVSSSTSLSVGTTTITGDVAAAVAKARACAGGVSPATTGVAAPSPARLAAFLSSALSVSELAVSDTDGGTYRGFGGRNRMLGVNVQECSGR